MRFMALPLLILSSLMTAALGASLKPGDPVPLEALRDCTFLQGEAPEAWEPGNLYLIECWFTTCGPCIEVMPHLKELHDKFKDKGLRVTAVSIHDAHPERVRVFMNDRPGLMTYPVAHASKNGSFIKEWVEPIGVLSMPQSLLIRDGKLLGRTSPKSLDNELINDLLKNDESAMKRLEELTSMREVNEKDSPEEEKMIKEHSDRLQQFYDMLGRAAAKSGNQPVSEQKNPPPGSPQESSDDDKLGRHFQDWIDLLLQNKAADAQEVLLKALRLSPSMEPPSPLENIFLMPQVVCKSSPGVDPARPILRALAKNGQGFDARLVPGAEVPLAALKACEFIQGKAPEVWEPGVLYLLECWSTTCGPRIAFLPEVNKLHDEFKDQGLQVIGVSLWEKNVGAVQEFVAANGAEMSYPVAFAGVNSPFSKEYVESAKILSFPISMFVRNGKLIALCTHKRLTKEMVGELLAGGERSAATEQALLAPMDIDAMPYAVKPGPPKTSRASSGEK